MSIKFEWHGREIEIAITRAIKVALYKAAGDLKQRSVQEVPWETRALQRNCGFDDREIDEGIIRIGYDIKTEYGFYYGLEQHERLDFHHPRGGKAKFLEDPFLQNKSKHLADIARAIREALS